MRAISSKKLTESTLPLKNNRRTMSVTKTLTVHDTLYTFFTSRKLSNHHWNPKGSRTDLKICPKKD